MRDRAMGDDIIRKHIHALNERNGDACDHLTVRTPYLPCPHPQCFTDLMSIFRVARKNPAHRHYFSMQSPSPSDPEPMIVEDWVREIVWVNRQFPEVWAWVNP